MEILFVLPFSCSFIMDNNEERLQNYSRRLQNRFLDGHWNSNMVYCNSLNCFRICNLRLSKQRYDDRSCDCKSCLIFLYVTWINKKYCYWCLGYFRNNTWPCFLFNISRLVYFIWWSVSRNNCIYSWGI